MDRLCHAMPGIMDQAHPVGSRAHVVAKERPYFPRCRIPTPQRDTASKIRGRHKLKKEKRVQLVGV